MTPECFRDVHHTEMVMKPQEFRITRALLCGGPRLDQLMILLQSLEIENIDPDS